MGRGRENTTVTLRYKLSLFDDRIGEYVASGGSMAGGHTRSSSCDSGVSSSAGYIEHTVSRFDTLAGIAIKYGVEVTDVKRMNGLVTDSQMFALKTLKIPLPGRHPPSSPTSLGFSSKQCTPRGGKQRSPGAAKKSKDASSSWVQEKRPVTSAMGLLRGYYGLTTPTTRHSEQGMEMAVYKSDSDYQSEDEPFSPQDRLQEAPGIRPLHDNHRLQNSECDTRFDDFRWDGRSDSGRPTSSSKYSEPFSKSSRSAPFRPEISAGDSGGTGDLERGNERPVRRRGKAEGGTSLLTVATVDMSFTPDVESSSRITVPLGKSSVLRPTIITKVDVDQEMRSPPRPVGSPTNGLYTNNDNPSAGSVAARALSSTILSSKTVEGIISKIRRSTSVPSLQDDRKSNKGDSSTLFSLGAAPSTQGGVISSVLEGFPVPVVRRNKAALD